MDRREAIQELSNLAWVYGNANRNKAIEALDLAIEALALHDKHSKAVERMIEGAKEIKIFIDRMTCDYKAIQGVAKTATTTDCISRDGLLFALEPMMKDWEGMKTVKLVIETIPSVKLINPCNSLLTEDSEACKEQKSKLEHDLVYRGEAEATDTDLISRQAAIDIVDQFSREEMYHYLESLELSVQATNVCHSAVEAVGEIKEQIESLPPVTPQVSEDAISRADTIKAMCLECWSKGACGADYCTDIEVVRGMPPVEPERPTGEWIFNPKDAIDSMFTKPKCSNCGFESADGGNFCPNCGAKMKGGKE